MSTKYQEIAQVLRERIWAGQWAVGDRLPTTSDLANEFDTSRATIAQALSRVGREGWISYTGARTGWQVATPQRRRRLSRNRLGASEREQGRGFFLSDAAQVGATPSVSTTVSTESLSDDTAALLEMEPGSLVVQRDRVMRLNGQVAQLAVGRVPADIAAGTAIENENPGDGGIVQRLSDLGYRITSHVERVLPGRHGSDEEVSTLHMPAGSLVTEITRVSYAGDRPVLVETIVLPPQTIELLYEIATD